jgi:hypothetical protein
MNYLRDRERERSRVQQAWTEDAKEYCLMGGFGRR